jgi:hypothetical protein
VTVAAELIVEIKGREVGLEALLKRIEQRLRDLDAAAQKGGASVGGGLSAAQARAATTAGRLATEQQRTALAMGRTATEAQRTAAATSSAAAAQSRAEQAAIRLAQAQQRVAEASAKASSFTKQIGDSVTGSFTSMLGPVALVTAGIGAATAGVRSFADAFVFKAELDAMTASINAQLTGVRDTGRVYSEAAAFARTYKLTQEETTGAIQASIGVMRNSKASVEDILSVLARLQILSPEQSLQEAAVAVRALASGDTTSLVTRFEVSRDVAGQMKQEIQGGADAVQVMSKFLNDTGIGMDALAAKTTGVAGALKDVAIAEEELALAQAEFSQGPGMVILNERIEVTRGLTRLLSGDFAAMGQSIVNSASTGAVAIQNIERDLAMIQQTAAANGGPAAAGLQELTAQILQAAAASPEAADGVLNMAAAVSTGELSVENFRAALAGLIGHQQAVAAAATQAGASNIYQSQAMIEASNAAQTNAAAMVEQTQKTLAAKIESEQLAAFQATLARIGGAVASGHLTAAAGAAQLAAQYGLARDQAYSLVQAQAALAGIQASGGATAAQGVEQYNARLVAQGEHYKALRAAQEQQTIQIGSAAAKQATLNAQLERAKVTYGQQSVQFIQAQTALKAFQAQQAKPVGGGGGGGALTKQLKAQESFNTKSIDLEEDRQQKLLDIEEDFAGRRAAASDKFNLESLEGRLSFYERLGQIEDAGLRDALAAKYEAAVQKAQQIAATQGTDAGDAFMEAAEKGLADEARIRAAIVKAREEGDTGAVEFNEGLLAIQQRTDAERLRQVEAAGSQINTEYAKQIAQLEEKSAASIDRLQTKLERATGSSTVSGAETATGATAAPAAPGAAATTQAVPIDLSAILSALRAGTAAVTAAIQANERATREGANQVSSAVSARAFS